MTRPGGRDLVVDLVCETTDLSHRWSQLSSHLSDRLPDDSGQAMGSSTTE